MCSCAARRAAEETISKLELAKASKEELAAVEIIDKLAKANKEELKARSYECPICLEMLEEARVTPCKHFFHGACLRMWLSKSNKRVCPRCYIEMKDPSEEVIEVRPVEPPPPPRDR